MLLCFEAEAVHLDGFRLIQIQQLNLGDLSMDMITIHLVSQLYDTAKISNDQTLDYTKMDNLTHPSICLIFCLDTYFEIPTNVEGPTTSQSEGYIF